MPMPRPYAPLRTVACIAVALTTFGPVFSQLGLSPADDFALAIEKGGVDQDLAWVGGLNHPQFYSVDVDGDGLLDYYAFDRAGDVHVAIGPESAAAPERYVDKKRWVRAWPKAQHFVVPRDYDGDGVVDLFTSASESGREGIFVFKGNRSSDGALEFAAVDFGGFFGEVLPYTTNANTDQLIYVANTDVPAIEDVDGDGDLDILAFEPSGSYIYLYRNNAVAYGEGPRARLNFARASLCYGGVIEDANTSELRLADDAGSCAPPSLSGKDQTNRGGLHPGSTLTLYDLDGDGDLDGLVGDVQTGALTALYNAPVNGLDYYDRVGMDWPSGQGEMPVALDYFPNAYPVAAPGTVVGGDTRAEILVASNQKAGGEDFDNVWRYVVGDEVDYAFRTRSLFTDAALDHGTGTHPAAGQLDGTGGPELIVGNFGTYAPEVAGLYKASLRYYRCRVEARCAEAFPYWLTDLNAALRGSPQDPFVDFDPVLHDMDADGDLDLLVGYSDGGLAYARNTTRGGGEVSFELVSMRWQGIRKGTRSSPAVGDVNGDGLPDLVVGESSGKLNLYLNRGTPSSPSFSTEPDEEQYGGIVVRLPGFGGGASSRPAFVSRGSDGLALYVGTRQGRLLIYDELPAGPGGTARLADTLQSTAGDQLDPALFYDPVADQPIMLLGNRRGGLVPFRFDDTSPIVAPQRAQAVRVVPNPTTGPFTLEGLPADTRVDVYDALGRRVALDLRAGDGQLPDVLPKGFYVLRATDPRNGEDVSLRLIRQ